MCVCVCVQLYTNIYIYIYIFVNIKYWWFVTHGLEPASLLSPWDSSGKNTGVGCHFLLQGIFPTQVLNLGLLHCREFLHCLSHQGSPLLIIPEFGEMEKEEKEERTWSAQTLPFLSFFSQGPSSTWAAHWNYTGSFKTNTDTWIFYPWRF